LNNQKKALAYIRVSRLGREKSKSVNARFRDKESPQTQMEHIKRYCEQKGYEILNIFEDLDYSGGTDDRPDFQKMFHEIRTNKDVDAVIVYSLSRFARDVLDLNKYLVVLEEHKVDFVSCTEEFLRTDTMYGKFLINIIGAVAQLQREQIAENVRDNMRNKALRGQFLGGIPPFGYVLNEDNQKFVIKEEEAEVIKLIFDRYINGDGIIKIRNYLNKNAFLGRDDYSVGTLQSILKNVHYTGDYVYSKRKNISRTKKKKTDEEEWIIVENNHPPIISKQQFLSVQKLMKKRNRSNPENLDRRVSGNQFLSGILQCSSCGHKYYHGPKRNGSGNKFDYYVCGGYKTKGKPYCTNKRGLRIDWVDQLIHDSIIEVLNKDTFLNMYKQTFSDMIKKIEAGLSESAEITKEIDRLKDEQSRYLKLIVRTDNDQLINQYEGEIQFRNEEIKNLEGKFKDNSKNEKTKEMLIELKKLIEEMFFEDENFKEFVVLGINQVGPITRNFVRVVEIQDEEEFNRTKLDITFAFRKEELKLLLNIKSAFKLYNRMKSNKNELTENEAKGIQEIIDKGLNEYNNCVYNVEFGPPVTLSENELI
jgi:site-specific DNA recombinase